MSQSISVDLILRSAKAAALSAVRQLSGEMETAQFEHDDVEQIAREALVARVSTGALDANAYDDVERYLFVVARNAIIDALRAAHPASTQTQRDLAAIAQAAQQWRQLHEGQPGVRELMAETGLSERRVRRAVAMRAVLGTVPWDEAVEGFLCFERPQESRIAEALAVQAALEQLKPSDRILLRLVAADGCTSAEIAEARGVSRQAVAKQVRIAKQRFEAAYRVAVD